jgi:sRNA-binding protein
MTSPYRIERDRGINEYRKQLAELREKWPLAFPVDDQDVRPLAVDATHEIAAVMGWSLPYTLGVLSRWKMAPVYCQAILCFDQRVALDGSPAEMVEAKAKDLATKHLARLAAGKAAKTAAPAMVKSKPARAPSPAPPPERPKQLRDLVRASLFAPESVGALMNNRPQAGTAPSGNGKVSPKSNTRGSAALRRPRSGPFSVNESNPAADHQGIGSLRVNFRRPGLDGRAFLTWRHQPRRQSNCAAECVQRCCAGAHRRTKHAPEAGTW